VSVWPEVGLQVDIRTGDGRVWQRIAGRRGKFMWDLTSKERFRPPIAPFRGTAVFWDGSTHTLRPLDVLGNLLQGLK
jgi:hypothetical protein